MIELFDDRIIWFDNQIIRFDNQIIWFDDRIIRFDLDRIANRSCKILNCFASTLETDQNYSIRSIESIRYPDSPEFAPMYIFT